MKKTYAFLMALFFCVAAAAQGLLPELSTEDNPVWYRVQFKTGSAFLTDKGNGAELQTAAGSSSDAQKWQLIGNKDNFKMKSKIGRYVNWNGSKYTASKTAGVALKIVQSTNASATDCWEIQRASGSQSMNQWGGAGAGKTLGEWTLGDANNPLSFVATAAKLPVFSSGDTENGISSSSATATVRSRPTASTNVSVLLPPTPLTDSSGNLSEQPTTSSS